MTEITWLNHRHSGERQKEREEKRTGGFTLVPSRATSLIACAKVLISRYDNEIAYGLSNSVIIDDLVRMIF